MTWPSRFRQFSDCNTQYLQSRKVVQTECFVPLKPGFISRCRPVSPNPSATHSRLPLCHLHVHMCFLTPDSLSDTPKVISFALGGHYPIRKQVSFITNLFSTSFCCLLVLTEIWLFLDDVTFSVVPPKYVPYLLLSSFKNSVLLFH